MQEAQGGIKQNEVRIGNLIQFDVGIFPISTIGETTFSCIANSRRKAILHEDAKPIPLSEDWLIRFGFEKIANSMDFRHPKLNPTIKFRIETDGAIRVLCKGIDITILYAVHTLQNLIFSLTQTELQTALSGINQKG